MFHKSKMIAAMFGLALTALPALPVLAQDLPKPDGKEADMTKPVQVFLIMGQSNAVGMGHIMGDKPTTLETAVKKDKKYQFLIDDAGNWAERKDVRYVRVMVGRGGGMQLFNNEFMQVNTKGKTMGIEWGVGPVVGNAVDAPVMILKSCIGNRSLGWDLLPPGSKSFEAEIKDKSGATKTYVYAGYKESPSRWEKGAKPEAIGWYAGKQYDDDIANAKKVLDELDKHYPGAKKYEMAGVFWWQGEKDCGDPVHAAHYEENFINFVQAIRKDFNSPNCKFVILTLGEAEKDKATGTEGTVLQAMFNLDSTSGKHPDLKGVATVYTHPVAQGGGGNGHYGGKAEVYMDAGLLAGQAMVKLLSEK